MESMKFAKTIGLTFLLAAVVLAIDLPNRRGVVNDFADVIPEQYEDEIEKLSVEVWNKSGYAIVVCSMPTIGDENPEDYAVRLYEHWGIGKKGEDKGVLIFNITDIRKLRIEVGYGMEGILNDARAGDIIRQVLAPRLREGDFGGGFLAAARVIAGIISDETGVEFDGKIVPQRQEDKNSPYGTICFILFILMMAFLSRRKRFASGSRGGGMYWGGFGGSGGFGGGFGSGGGFGGFGGGLSGGGGASGGY